MFCFLYTLDFFAANSLCEIVLLRQNYTLNIKNGLILCNYN